MPPKKNRSLWFLPLWPTQLLFPLYFFLPSRKLFLGQG